MGRLKLPKALIRCGMPVLGEAQYRKIRLTILRKLYSKGAWGKGHMLLDNMKSGIPSNLRGCVMPVIKDLVKEGLLKFYGPTAYGPAYHLNIGKKREVESEIGIQ